MLIYVMVSARSLAKLISELSDGDVSKRRAAAEALAGGDERAVYPLIKALRDENPGVQDAGMRSLVAIGGEVVAFMVIPLLREDPYLRNTALLILKELGGAALPYVYPLLKDKDEDIRKFSLDLLGEIKDGVLASEVLPLLRDPNPNVRAAAAKDIGVLGYREAIPELVKALKDEEWVCFAALEALGRLKAEGAVQDVAGLLNGSEAVRFAAIEALGEIGTEGAAAALLTHAPKTSGDEKKAAVKGLIRMGVSSSVETSDMLIDMLGADDWDEKLIALRGLAALRDCRAIRTIIDIAGSLEDSSPDTEDRLYAIKDTLVAMGCTDELMEALAEESVKYRGKVVAVEILGELDCARAVPGIKKLLVEDMRDVRRAAVKALGGINSPDAKKTLLGLVKDRDGHIRKTVVRALGSRAEKSASDSLLTLLHGEQFPDVIDETVKALLSIDPKGLFSRIGGFSDRVKVVIGKLADDPDILLLLSEDKALEVRAAAISGLARAGEDARALKKLGEAVRDGEPEIRRVAVMALGELNHCHEAIKSLLSDPDIWVRMYAVEALGRCFTHDIIRTLKPMLKDKEAPVVLSAIEAISRVGGKEAFGALSPLRSHPDETVRAKALRAMEGL